MGMKNINFDISVGTGIIGAFERIDIKSENIFSEFIDNAYQSFLDNKDKLIKEVHSSKCVVNIEWSEDSASVKDNAFGMDQEQFGRALKLNERASKYSQNSLSRYGMGLKYAAANLGDKRTIESSQFGSNECFRAVVDINNWKTENPTTLTGTLNDNVEKEEHFTQITVEKLKRKPDKKKIEDLKRKLGIIYQDFINDDLEIWVNSEKVEYELPPILKNNAGNEEMEFFEKEFYFEGKRYVTSGWIGVLHKGSTANAGFVLKQNKRVIQLGYRPKEICGNVNDARYQRITGEIIFPEEFWDVRVNKDGIVWAGTGLEDKFLESINVLPQVNRITKLAKEIKFREKPERKIKHTVTYGRVENLDENYRVGTEASFRIIPNDGYIIKSVKLNNQELEPRDRDSNFYAFMIENDLPMTSQLNVICEKNDNRSIFTDPINGGGFSVPPTPDKKEPPKKTFSKKELLEKTFEGLKETKIKDVSVEESPNLFNDGVVVQFSNTKYSFEILEINDSSKEWFSLKQKIGNYENSYIVTINYGSGFLKKSMFTEDMKIIFRKLCISIAIAQITSQGAGLSLDNSKILIDKINDTILKTGD